MSGMETDNLIEYDGAYWPVFRRGDAQDGRVRP